MRRARATFVLCILGRLNRTSLSCRDDPVGGELVVVQLKLDRPLMLWRQYPYLAEEIARRVDPRDHLPKRP